VENIEDKKKRKTVAPLSLSIFFLSSTMLCVCVCVFLYFSPLFIAFCTWKRRLSGQVHRNLLQTFPKKKRERKREKTWRLLVFEHKKKERKKKKKNIYKKNFVEDTVSHALVSCRIDYSVPSSKFASSKFTARHRLLFMQARCTWLFLLLLFLFLFFFLSYYFYWNQTRH